MTLLYRHPYPFLFVHCPFTLSISLCTGHGDAEQDGRAVQKQSHRTGDRKVWSTFLGADTGPTGETLNWDAFLLILCYSFGLNPLLVSFLTLRFNIRAISVFFVCVVCIFAIILCESLFLAFWFRSLIFFSVNHFFYFLCTGGSTEGRLRQGQRGSQTGAGRVQQPQVTYFL